MGLDVEKMVQDMLGVMKPILGQKWGEVQQYAKDEASKVALTLTRIEVERATGAITEAQAKLLVEMQKNASSAVLATVWGVGELAAAQALNAAMAALADPINKAIGFKLL